MQKGELLTVDISGVSSEGDGIARVGSDGFVVFVRYALPGEQVRCVVTGGTKRFARATTTEIIRAADVRRRPICRHFTRCGGCRLQHASYGAQTAIKAKILTDALVRIANVAPPEIIECVPSPNELGYRNKTSLPVRSLGPKRPFVCGYFEEDSHRIVQYRECPVLVDPLQALVPELIASVRSSGISAWDERRGEGLLRWIAARSGGERDELAIACAVVSREPSRRESGRLRDELQRSGASLRSFVGASMNINAAPGNFIWGPKFVPLFGRRTIEQRLGDSTFESEVSSFFQINRAQAETLFGYVASLARASAPGRALELYAGVGGMTAYLARECGSVDAVEEWRPSARAIEPNLQRCGLTNVRAWSCSAEEFFAGREIVRGEYDLIVLDPPRSGVPEQVTNAIIAAAPRDVIYVSCAPATLARDTARLIAGGYDLASVKAFDMFPQTQHVEAAVHMTRRSQRT